MAIAGELPEGGTQKATFRKGAEGPAEQRGGAGGDQGGEAGDGGEAGELDWKGVVDYECDFCCRADSLAWYFQIS